MNQVYKRSYHSNISSDQCPSVRYSSDLHTRPNQNIFKDFQNNKKFLYCRSKRIAENNKKPNYVFYLEFTPELDFLIHNPIAFVAKSNNKVYTFHKVMKEPNTKNFIIVIKKEVEDHERHK